MKTLKQPFILFFVAGMVPTAAELAEAGKLRARVGYRNASVVTENEAPEPCDGVAGKVPPPYKKFPTAAAAIAEYDRKLEAGIKAADAAVGKPPTAKPAPGPGAGKAPAGFENLPGGDGSVGAPAGAPAAPAATSDATGEGKPGEAGQTNAPPAGAGPAADANTKPPTWGGKGKSK